MKLNIPSYIVSISGHLVCANQDFIPTIGGKLFDEFFSGCRATVMNYEDNKSLVLFA
jgi:hypothetical protein